MQSRRGFLEVIGAAIGALFCRKAAAVQEVPTKPRCISSILTVDNGLLRLTNGESCLFSGMTAKFHRQDQGPRRIEVRFERLIGLSWETWVCCLRSSNRLCLTVKVDGHKHPFYLNRSDFLLYEGAIQVGPADKAVVQGVIFAAESLEVSPDGMSKLFCGLVSVYDDGSVFRAGQQT